MSMLFAFLGVPAIIGLIASRSARGMFAGAFYGAAVVALIGWLGSFTQSGLNESTARLNAVAGWDMGSLIVDGAFLVPFAVFLGIAIALSRPLAPTNTPANLETKP